MIGNTIQSIYVCSLSWCRHSKVSFPLQHGETGTGKTLPLCECISDKGDPQFSEEWGLI